MCSKKVFSLQFHAGKRRDDILKDPGTKTNVAPFCDDGFSQTPIISSQDKLKIAAANYKLTPIYLLTSLLFYYVQPITA